MVITNSPTLTPSPLQSSYIAIKPFFHTHLAGSFLESDCIFKFISQQYDFKRVTVVLLLVLNRLNILLSHYLAPFPFNGNHHRSLSYDPPNLTVNLPSNRGKPRRLLWVVGWPLQLMHSCIPQYASYFVIDCEHIFLSRQNVFKSELCHTWNFVPEMLVATMFTASMTCCFLHTHVFASINPFSITLIRRGI